MNSHVVFFVDAPQHYRIVAAIVRTLVAPCDVLVLAATATSLPLRDTDHVQVRVHHVAVEAEYVGSRILNTLSIGRARLKVVRAYMKAIALDPCDLTVVVCNDTGIVQRDLLRAGRLAGWSTVLVQDGLTETGYRENRWGFRIKRLITALLLEPLGLGAYGTSRYGESGASVILADGPPAAAFFRRRAPAARVVDVGFLRPPVADQGLGLQPRILFWAVDFLGGLQNEALHLAQLTMIEQLAGSIERAKLDLSLQVRLHPRDVTYMPQYGERLSGYACIKLIDSEKMPDPFADGVPMVSVSLQSAGVFDALAACVPSFFLRCDGRNLGPAWLPAALILEDVSVLIDRLKTMREHDHVRTELWTMQVKSIRSTMRIPFEVEAVRLALQSA